MATEKSTVIQEFVEACGKTGKVYSDEINRFISENNFDEDASKEIYRGLLTAGAEIIQPDDDILTDENIGRFEKSISDEGVSLDDPVKAYLNEIGSYRLLTSEEEKECAAAYTAGEKAANRLKDGDYADESEENELKTAVRKGRAAKERLINANLRLVVSNARRYIGRGLPFLDLIQEGNIGLMKAVEKYDYEKGWKFSTYATWWIKQAIVRAIDDTSKIIRLPVHMHETINRVRKVQAALLHQNGEEPTVEEIAHELDMEPAKVAEVLRTGMDPLSLENPVGEEDDSTLADFVPDENQTPEKLVEERQLKEAVQETLGTLTEREALVLTLRFGLDDGVRRTLEEVGQTLGVTRERVRQIEAKALRKLHSPSRGKMLKEFMDET